MTTQNPNFDLPPADQAKQVHDQIAFDVFIAKMAELGFSPRNEDEALSMWRTGQQLLDIQELPAVKQAMQQQSPLLEAERRLHELSAQYGLAPAKTAAEKAALNQITLSLAQDPDVYKAMLSLAHAESQASAG